jgi:hypothetical protein
MLNSQRPLLEFQIHLINGHSAVIMLTNPTDANAAITHFEEPERLFAHQDLIIAHDRATSVFRREHITWIDLVGDALPPWPLPLGAQAIDEITEQDYVARFGQNGSNGSLGGSHSAIEIEFINGKRLYWQVLRQPVELVGVDVVSLEHNMFKAGGLHARRSGGGVVIINPANVSRYTFVPGMAQLPLNALHGTHAEIR